MAYIASIGFVILVWIVIVSLNERYNLLSCDRFPSDLAKGFAYVWLLGFMILLAFMVTASALAKPTPSMLRDLSFVQVFTMQAILFVFLIGWWLASGRPPLREFLNIRHEKPAEVVAIGLSVGVGGWIITIVMALLVALLLQALGAFEQPPEPPAMIGWLANLALWKKALIILSAMSVEEFFFRSFLQKRIGLIASTALFALAHFAYGNPLLLIGVTVISLVIGFTFYRTKNVVPGIIAHGVFDAIQLFVIVPLAVKMIGGVGG
ncbi:MAG TPA: CPBP family intramembrane glutamic endopeptidase [Thermoanaerobaculia bacterium]|jgi:membrane protease YdiL (CAAX protease family)|nr:CPBP family intramembrane glutamic endopeptidase [Thermoanaerobaculia bacterium]